MNIRFVKKIAFLCILTIALWNAGCSKADKTYYDYKTTAGNYKGTILEYLKTQTGLYDSLLYVTSRVSGLNNLLQTGQVTLFAANNKSFELALSNINQARKDSFPSMPRISLSGLDSATLDTFMCRYIIPGLLFSDSLKGFTDGKLYPSYRYDYNMQLQYVSTNASGYLGGGPKTITFSDPRNSLFVRNWVRVNTLTVDITASNGVIHLLPPGHDVGFGNDFIKRINKR